MLIQYDLPKINKVLHDFYTATGTRIDLFDTSFVPISSSHHEICGYCNQVQKDITCKKSCIYFDRTLLQKSKLSQASAQDHCPFGLLNIVTPILHNGTAIGYLFFGQMKTEPNYPSGINEAQQAHYDALETYTLAKSQSIASLAEIVIGHILTENMLKPDAGDLLSKTVTFIQENLDKDLSIQIIAKRINASKSVLYKKFRDRFHCTVGEYINCQRVKRSTVLLTTTSFSMEEISQQCGFSSASYFTKVFKHQMGITPLKYKKSQGT